MFPRRRWLVSFPNDVGEPTIHIRPQLHWTRDAAFAAAWELNQMVKAISSEAQVWDRKDTRKTFR